MKEISRVLEILVYISLSVTFLIVNFLDKTDTNYAIIVSFILIALGLLTNIIYYLKNKRRRILSRIFSIIASMFFSLSILNLKDIDIISLAISFGIASLNLIASNIILLTSKEKIERSEEEKRKLNTSLKILLILFGLFVISLLFNVDILFGTFFILLIIEIIYLKIKYPEDDQLNGILNLIISLIILGFAFLMFAVKFCVEIIKIIIEAFAESAKSL